MINTASRLPAATWRDYLTLTKPKVISLLLFTAICPMFIAARGLPPGCLFSVFLSADTWPPAAPASSIWRWTGI